MPRQYPHQFRESALGISKDSLPEHEAEFTVMEKVASKLGISPEASRRSVSLWVPRRVGVLRPVVTDPLKGKPRQLEAFVINC
jgi:hypothetical protein